MNTPLSVTDLNLLIKGKLEGDIAFRGLTVKGEVSNYKVYPSGHAYFSLKDENSLLSCVMWASNRVRLLFTPQNGDEVIAKGRITVYPSRGSYQLSVDALEPFGQGMELLRLQQLKEKLAKEGLFDESRKRPLPSFPRRIGVIAGKGSAGMKDVIHNIAIRYRLATLCLFPSLVQGKQAPADLLRALELAKQAKLDVLIIARGGGASEDLGAFNDEALVREVAKFPCPVISAVGHEIDVTLIDYVADKRVSTPTAAALTATPDQEEIQAYVDDARDRLYQALTGLLDRLQEKRKSLAERPFFRDPSSIYQRRIEDVAHLYKRILAAAEVNLLSKSKRISELSAALEALSPHKVLKRGYSYLTDTSGKVIKSIKNVKLGENIVATTEDGIIHSTVIGTEANE